MPLADRWARRGSPAARLPDRIEELRGPARGVVRLPRHLTWPGAREFDLADKQVRCRLYGLVLTQGRRDDMARFLNPALLRQDWPDLAGRLDPRLRRWCERRFPLVP